MENDLIESFRGGLRDQCLNPDRLEVWLKHGWSLKCRGRGPMKRDCFPASRIGLPRSPLQNSWVLEPVCETNELGGPGLLGSQGMRARPE